MAGVIQQLLHWGLMVEKAVDKGAVGAIFQEAPHQVGQ